MCVCVVTMDRDFEVSLSQCITAFGPNDMYGPCFFSLGNEERNMT